MTSQPPRLEPGLTLNGWTVTQWSQGRWQLTHERGVRAAFPNSCAAAFVTRDSGEMPLVGATFGELLVLKYSGGRTWDCRCSCGDSCQKRTDRLLGGVSWCCDVSRHGQLAANLPGPGSNVKSQLSRRSAIRARRITVAGESLTVSQWARRLGISPDTIRQRLALGWSEADAVTRPRDPRGRVMGS